MRKENGAVLLAYGILLPYVALPPPMQCCYSASLPVSIATHMAAPLRILFLSSECAPWSKTGGLADVAASLPAALHSLGADVRLMTPAYASVPAEGAVETMRFAATAHYPPARVLEAALPTGVPALLLDCPPYYVRAGGPYQSAAGIDWPDNAQRFGLLCRVAAELACRRDETLWRPDVVHCNDWQTGLVPVYLAYRQQAHAPTVLTVHNLSFQGIFPAGAVAEIGLPPESFNVEGVEYYGQCSFLKGGIACADALTTVSPTYADEIQTAEHGMGLHGLLAQRRDALTGILNGIDTAVWDPARDTHLLRHYTAATLEGKAANKRALQRRAGLPQSELPLLAIVSRLTAQKGIDFVLELGAAIAALPAQLVVLGRGETGYEQGLTVLARSHPRHVSVTIGFDEALAHLIEAGADIFLMPSRFEPCGMNQMYSQRYGTVPVVRATGGLVDSVEDYSEAAGTGTGFVFREPSPAALLAAIGRAIAAFGNATAWRGLQRNGMARDFSWTASARRYLEIYQRVAAKP